MIGLYWMKGSGWAKMFGFVVGCASAWLAAPWLSSASGMDEGLAGGLLGMFGFSLIGKVFKTIQDIDVWPLLRDWLKKRLGVQ